MNRAAILTFAKEEMGHLLTVQNCLCLLGGPLSFEREDYPWDTPYYPFEFCLEARLLQPLRDASHSCSLPRRIDRRAEVYCTRLNAFAEKCGCATVWAPATV